MAKDAFGAVLAELAAVYAAGSDQTAAAFLAELLARIGPMNEAPRAPPSPLRRCTAARPSGARAGFAVGSWSVLAGRSTLVVLLVCWAWQTIGQWRSVQKGMPHARLRHGHRLSYVVDSLGQMVPSDGCHKTGGKRLFRAEPDGANSAVGVGITDGQGSADSPRALHPRCLHPNRSLRRKGG
jgi:hypothetical protein